MVKSRRSSVILRRFIAGFLATLMTCTASVSAKVQLPPGREAQWAENNILFYNPGCEEISSTHNYDGPVSVIGGTVAEMIWSGLTSFLTPEQAAGVMGNMQSESGFHPAKHEYSSNASDDIYNDSGPAHGIGLIQWSFGRRVNLLATIPSNLRHYFDNRSTYNSMTAEQFLAAAGEADTAALITLELDFLRQELESSYSDFFSTSSVAEAATYFLERVERPKNPYIEYHPARLRQAEAYFNEYSGTTISGSPFNVTAGSSVFCPEGSEDGDGSTGIPRDNGDINATALALAWPNRSMGGCSEPSPAYKAAMQALGIWGKGNGGNTDYYASFGCSCDVFVATVMRYSGADPNFPLYLGNQKPYLANNPRYEVVNVRSTADLQPGDIRIENGGGHIVLIVQKPDGSLGIASASHGGRTGDIGGFYNASGTVYRLRGGN